MPTGPEIFLELPAVSGIRPSARTHLKKAFITLIRSVGQTKIPTSSQRWAGTHHGQPCLSVWIWPGVSRLHWQLIDELQGTILLGSKPPEKDYVYRLVPKVPFLAKCRRGPRPFWSRRAFLDKYRLPPSSRTWLFSGGHFYPLYSHSYFIYIFCSSIDLFHLLSLLPCLLSGP